MGGQNVAFVSLRNPAEYRRAIDEVRTLQTVMARLATQKGNVHPEVVALSQQLDEYIVSIQRYWQYRGREGVTG